MKIVKDSDEYLRDVIHREFFRGMRNGLLMGFAVGFAMSWVLWRVLEAM